MNLQFPLQNAFIALPLEGEAKQQFVQCQDELHSFDTCLRFQNPHTPHLTLYFWKELMEIEYDQMRHYMERIVTNRDCFTLKITGVDTFSNTKGQDRILYFSVAFSEQLASVKKACPWPNVQPFHPHITIARISHSERFAIHKKEILKRLKHYVFTMNVSCVRCHAKVNEQHQTPLQNFEF